MFGMKLSQCSEFTVSGECQRPSASVSYPYVSKWPAISALPDKHLKRHSVKMHAFWISPPNFCYQSCKQNSSSGTNYRKIKWTKVTALPDWWRSQLLSLVTALCSCLLSERKVRALAFLLSAVLWMAAQHIEVIDSSWLSHNLNQLDHLIFPTAKESCRS